ncbi:MAG TPA: hypothetical protein VFZ31_00430 [Vicinamibacterales bacterium]
MTFALLAGLAAGMLHVLAGPDHLAAVTPLVLGNEQRPARRVAGWKTGLQWGIGHTAGVVLIAALLLLLSEQLPLDAISGYSERIVGMALIAVGFWGIRSAWLRRSGSDAVHAHGKASFGFGILHGLAGSSHLFGVLPALAFSRPSDAALYLAGFGFGAIAGMSAFAAVVGVVGNRLGANHPARYRGFVYASSAIALAIGGFWLVA